MIERSYPAVEVTLEDIEALDVYRHTVDQFRLNTDSAQWEIFAEGSQPPLVLAEAGLTDLLVESTKLTVELEAVMLRPPSPEWHLSKKHEQIQLGLQHAQSLRVAITEVVLHSLT